MRQPTSFKTEFCARTVQQGIDLFLTSLYFIYLFIYSFCEFSSGLVDPFPFTFWLHSPLLYWNNSIYVNVNSHPRDQWGFYGPLKHCKLDFLKLLISLEQYKKQLFGCKRKKHDTDKNYICIFIFRWLI